MREVVAETAAGLVLSRLSAVSSAGPLKPVREQSRVSLHAIVMGMPRPSSCEITRSFHEWRIRTRTLIFGACEFSAQRLASDTRLQGNFRVERPIRGSPEKGSTLGLIPSAGRRHG